MEKIKYTEDYLLNNGFIKESDGNFYNEKKGLLFIIGMDEPIKVTPMTDEAYLKGYELYNKVLAGEMTYKEAFGED